MKKRGMKWALGAMPVEAPDGIAAATLLTDGENIEEFGDTLFDAFSPSQRAVIRAAYGNWYPHKDVAETVENAHAMTLNQLPEAEVIGFHGLTLTHEPGARGSLEVGNGALLAEVLNKPVVWDFKSSDMELGGQGAPIEAFYHFALAKKIGVDQPIAILDIGPVSTLTWVDPSLSRPEQNGAIMSFHCGPGVALIDRELRKRTSGLSDQIGKRAEKGTPDSKLVEEALSGKYFVRMPPKSLDRLAFAGIGARLTNRSDFNTAATLALLVAGAAGLGVSQLPEPPEKVLVSGQGRKNRAIMRMLTKGLDVPVLNIDKAGIKGDMVSAQAMAYLAVRVLYGLPTTAPGTTGVAAPVGGGQISRP